MTEAPLRKRDRETEVLPNSINVRKPKRFHGEETHQFLHLLQLDEKSADDEVEKECPPSEELVKEVMRSLEEEIAAICSTSYSSNSVDNVVVADISRGHEVETVASDSPFDLCYLLEASDDELGIPPSPVLNLEDVVCPSPMETSEGLLESRDFKFLGEKWNFDDDFENYQQFSVYEDPWDTNQLQDYINRDSFSLCMLFDGSFSAA